MSIEKKSLPCFICEKRKADPFFLLKYHEMATLTDKKWLMEREEKQEKPDFFIPEKARICSKHFNEADFEAKLAKTYLTTSADVPVSSTLEDSIQSIPKLAEPLIINARPSISKQSSLRDFILARGSGMEKNKRKRSDSNDGPEVDLESYFPSGPDLQFSPKKNLKSKKFVENVNQAESSSQLILTSTSTGSRTLHNIRPARAPTKVRPTFHQHSNLVPGEPNICEKNWFIEVGKIARFIARKRSLQMPYCNSSTGECQFHTTNPNFLQELPVSNGIDQIETNVRIMSELVIIPQPSSQELQVTETHHFPHMDASQDFKMTFVSYLHSLGDMLDSWRFQFTLLNNLFLQLRKFGEHEKLEVEVIQNKEFDKLMVILHQKGSSLRIKLFCRLMPAWHQRPLVVVSGGLTHTFKCRSLPDVAAILQALRLRLSPESSLPETPQLILGNPLRYSKFSGFLGLMQQVAVQTKFFVDFQAANQNMCTFYLSEVNFLVKLYGVVVVTEVPQMTGYKVQETIHLRGLQSQVSTTLSCSMEALTGHLNELKSQFQLMAQFNRLFHNFLQSNHLTSTVCSGDGENQLLMVEIGLDNLQSPFFQILWGISQTARPIIELTLVNLSTDLQRKRNYAFRDATSIHYWLKVLQVILQPFLKPERSLLDLLNDCLKGNEPCHLSTYMFQDQIRAMKKVNEEMQQRGYEVSTSTKGIFNITEAVCGDFKLLIFFKQLKRKGNIEWGLKLFEPMSLNCEEYSVEFSQLLDVGELIVNYHSCLELFFFEAERRMSQIKVEIVEEQDGTEMMQSQPLIKIEKE